MPYGIYQSRSVLLSSRQCCDWSATVFAGLATFQFRVAADVGSDCVHRKSQPPCDFCRGFPLEPHLVNDVDFLFCHSVYSPFEFAFSNMVLPTRCPLYRHRDPYRAWGLFPQKLMRIRAWLCLPAVRMVSALDTYGPTPIVFTVCSNL